MSVYKRQSQYLTFVAIYLLPLIAACSSTKIPRTSHTLSRAEVAYLNKTLQTKLEKYYPPLEHKTITQYVRALGQSIVAKNKQMSPLPYKFRILQTNKFYIFSLPGGTVYTSVGALKSFQLQGQLAAALAHELAHQDLKHPIALWERSQKKYPFIPPHSLYSRGNFQSFFFGKDGPLDYKEDSEREADEIALIILQQSGFDPRLSISYLELLKKRQKRKKNGPTHSLHPSIKKRIAWTRKFIRNLPPKKNLKITSPNFKKIKHLLREIKTTKNHNAT